MSLAHARGQRMLDLPAPPFNRLLLALPPRQLKRLAPDLERIECSPGQILADVDRPMNDVFFPETAVISVVAVYEDGRIIEMATIGREGCTGAQAVFGGRMSPSRLLVQIPGIAIRMRREAFMRSMEEIPSFRTLMHAYTQAFLDQVLISVACNGAHGLNQRFARWLLMMRDRSDSDVLEITQSLLGDMLGVQRPTISNAAREFERQGLIARGRRQVTILDRARLARAACECYQLVRSRFSVHLPKTYSGSSDR
jgi:CRP-like cAMP-binding protein